MSAPKSISDSWSIKLTLITVTTALCLLFAVIYGYLYNRWQQSNLPDKYIRIVLSGPSEIELQGTNLFTLQTKTLNGEPISAHVNFVLRDSSNSPFLNYQENSDENGQLTISIDGSKIMPEYSDRNKRSWIELYLEVDYNGQQQTCSIPLNVNPRSAWEPNWGKMPISDFVTSISQYDIREDSGLQWEMCPTEVESETGIARPEPHKMDKIRFFPEGGRVIADLENRVYLWIRPTNTSETPRGIIVDENNALCGRVDFNPMENGSLFTTGNFVYFPKYNTQYYLVLTDNVDSIKDLPRISLPSALRSSRFTISVKKNVIHSTDSVELTVRSNYQSLPLIAQLRLQDTILQSIPFFTAGTTNELKIPIPERTSGLLELLIFDSGLKKPVATVQSWIYCVNEAENETTAQNSQNNSISVIKKLNSDYNSNYTSGIIGVVPLAVQFNRSRQSKIFQTPFIYDNYLELQSDLKPLLTKYYSRSRQALVSTASIVLIGGLALQIFVIFCVVLGLPCRLWGTIIAFLAAWVAIGMAFILIQSPPTPKLNQPHFISWTPEKVELKE